MVEPGEGLRFLLEATQSIRVLGDICWHNFDRDIAVELGVPGTIDDTHSASANERANFTTSEPGADINTHWLVLLVHCSVFVNCDYHEIK